MYVLPILEKINIHNFSLLRMNRADHDHKHEPFYVSVSAIQIRQNLHLPGNVYTEWIRNNANRIDFYTGWDL